MSHQTSTARPPLPGICHAMAVLLVFLPAALYPYHRSDGVNTAAALILLIYGLAATTRGRERFIALQQRLQRSENSKNVLLLISSLIVLVGGLEIAGQILTRTKIVEADPAMRTLLPQGVADFRTFHITADKYRMPDPVLLWRPMDRWPYNSQHMKGTVAALPKPPDVFRIICYGDSNTDGPNENTWPERLEQLLNERRATTERRFEVLNAGVAGYSSYQGLLRFRQQVEEFDPDLIFVSFGWNDAAPAVGQPDRLYQPPGPLYVAAERVLIRYRFYRVMQKLIRPSGPERVDTDVQPRVPINDYLTNLDDFGKLSRANDIGVIYLTRPYEVPREGMLKALGDMRIRVPSYNDALRQFGQPEDVQFIDVHQHFAFEGNKPLFTDDAHFSESGVDRMAELLYEHLIASLEKL